MDRISKAHAFHARKALPLVGAFTLTLLSLGCPAERDSNTFAPPTPVDAPVKNLPVPLDTVASQIPAGIDAYQLVRVRWEGMKPARASFERFVRGSCYVQAHYAFAEGGILTQVPPSYRAGPVGKSLGSSDLIITDALGVASGPESPDQVFDRDPMGRLAWVWKKGEAVGELSPESIWTFSYPEDAVCIAPAVLARENIPAKMKPTLTPRGGQPGETASEPMPTRVPTPGQVPTPGPDAP